MPLKRNLQQAILRAIARVPPVSAFLQKPGVRNLLEKLPGGRALYPSGWDRPHPFDLAHGVDTSGFVPVAELPSSLPGVAPSQPYGPSQPSSLRAALAALPGLKACTFIDLGCGKGRPILVASEFPFRDIVGVELSPPLAKVARANARIFAARFPERPRVRVEEGDASAFPLPPGDLVLFLYNPFSQKLTSMLAARLEAALAAQGRSIYVIYCNPVFGAAFDASRVLTRRFARMVPCAPEELGFGTDIDEAVVVWQGGNAPPPFAPADARIVITKPGLHAVLGA